MFQDFALFPHLSVSQNVAFGLKIAKSERDQRVAELLDRVEMGRFAKAFPH